MFISIKKSLLISALLATECVLFCCSGKKMSPEKQVAQKLLAQTDSFSTACNELLRAVVAGTTPEEKMQQLFLRTRIAYKRIEWATEYFLPANARSVNGPPVVEVELSGQVFDPAGLQVVEGLLFPRYDPSNRGEISKQLQLVMRTCNQFKTHFEKIDILNWQVFDATKLEVFRIETMGITGFDNPLTLQSAAEASAALQSVRDVLAFYDSGELGDMNKNVSASLQYLASHNDFNSFDRAAFITRFADPVTRSITHLEKELDIPVTRYNRLLNQDAETLFDTNAFNVNAYSPDQSSFVTKEKISLGEKLFSDPLLSGDGARSCRSCHQPARAFTDGLVKNTVLGDKGLLQRNTPTLINAALQPSQFYDGRVSTLEAQSASVVQNEEEMHGSLRVSVNRLWQDSGYRAMFTKAFPKPGRTQIDTLEVMNALGSYVRSLTYLNSRFDRYMRGDLTAMNKREIDGFNLFMGKAKCATCHYMPLFNGTPPPRYMKMETEVIGVPVSVSGKAIDPDSGRYRIVHHESFLHAFKTPSLRNAALTAPYMHNGVYSTLEQVIDFYDRGGGKGSGFEVSNQTLPPEKLNLTAAEKSSLLAFLKTLNSRM